MPFIQTGDSLMWLYVVTLGLALAAAGYILYRRWQSRRALVARIADLTVLAEIGRAITDAPLDLAQLASVVYRQAGQIVDTTIFQLGLFHGDRYRLLIWVVDGQPQLLQEFHLTPSNLGIVGWLRESRRSLLVRDFESEQATLPAQPRYISPNPPRSAVFVPLAATDSVLGAIAVQSRRPAAFSEEDLRLLTIVANHAAAALAKAQVYEQAQQRAAQLALLGEVTRQINILQPLSSLYRQIVETISARLVDYEVSFFEQAGDGLRLQATTVGEWKAQIGISAAAEGVAAEAAAARQTVVRESLPELEEGGGGDGLPAIPMAELGVPVIIEDRLCGVLHIRSRTSPAFDANAISLFESLANQIAFAILESELYTAEQRRSTQLAAIAQISRTIVSALELEELFDDVLDRVEESFGYKRAHIFLLNDDRLVFRSGIGKGAARWAVHGLAYNLDGRGLIATAGRTRRAMLTADTVQHPDYLPGSGLEDTRAEMAAPMIMGEKLLGVFDVQSEKPGRFTADDLQILQTLADTLAVAVRNARLFEIERRRRHLAETLRDVSAAVTSTLDLDDVLDLILTGLERVVAYDAASILLVNETGELILRAGRGLPELHAAVGDVLDISLYPHGESFPATINFGEVDRQHEYHDLIALPDPHACLGAVLALRGEHIGYLVVDRAGETRFPQGEVELIGAFASQAAVAIENARLYTAQLEQAWVSTALLQVTEATTRATELNEVIQTVARLTPMLVGVERCAVLMREGDAFWVKAFYGQGATMPSLESTPGFTGQVWPKLQALIDTRDVVVIAEHEIADELPVGLSHWFAGVVILLPLLAKGEVQGVLMVGQDLGAVPFTSHRIELLGGIANQTAVA
ncbi:MAG TPA: GAF domain-containing protein, partial [Anaerolineales bacterium]|nr:GAF domain-containing protein [Anaerolineales bacterium]